MKFPHAQDSRGVAGLTPRVRGARLARLLLVTAAVRRA